MSDKGDEGLVVVDAGVVWHIHVRFGVSKRWAKAYEWTQVNVHQGECILDSWYFPDNGRGCGVGSHGYTQKTPKDRPHRGEGIKKAFERAVHPYAKLTRAFLWRALWCHRKQPGQDHMADQLRQLSRLSRLGRAGSTHGT